jgi:5-methylcytosine-specific restriction endonuclease McrA
MCKIHYCRDYHQRNRDRELENYRQRYQAKREQERARIAAYYQANSEQIRARAKANRAAQDPAHRRALGAAWRQRNPGYGARKRRENPEAFRLRNRENARRRRCGDGSVSYAAILERDGMVCHLCGGEIVSIEDLHFDHVVPLSRGGQHVAENVRPAHKAGNLWKHNRLIEELVGDPPCKVA